MILVNLPLEDLISVHQACKAARDVVKDSKMLHQNLYAYVSRSPFTTKSFTGDNRHLPSMIPTPLFQTLDFCMRSSRNGRSRYFVLRLVYPSTKGLPFEFGFEWISDDEYVWRYGFEGGRRLIEVNRDEEHSTELWRSIHWVQPGRRHAVRSGSRRRLRILGVCGHTKLRRMILLLGRCTTCSKECRMIKEWFGPYSARRAP